MKSPFIISSSSLILVATFVFEMVSLIYMNKCDQLNLPLIIAIILVVIIIIGLLSQRKNNKHILIKLILNFKGEAGNWYGILSILFVIVNLNWLGNACWEFIDNPVTFLPNGMKAIIITEFLFIPFVISGFYNISQKSYPKVLISGLSLPGLVFMKDVDVVELDGTIRKKKERKEIHEITDNELITKLNEHSDTKSSGSYDYYSIKDRKWGRWDGIQKSLTRHPEIETVVLIPSQENMVFLKRIGELRASLNENWDITSIIPNSGKKNIKVILSDPTDVNDIENVKLRINDVLKLKILPKYKDEDLLFSITASTAIVSSAMILCSLKGQRCAEYIHQTTNEICEIDLDVLSVQDLWDEILFKMQEQNSERMK